MSQSESQARPLLQPSVFQSVEFPSSIRLTPFLCHHVLLEFLKQLLYAKDQIPFPLHQLIEQHKNSKKNLKLTQFMKSMQKCQESVLRFFQYHFKQSTIRMRSCNESSTRTIYMDCLLLFGKSYIAPLETYSLRFYIDDDDLGMDNNPDPVDPSTLCKLKTIVGRSLHGIEAIWDSPLLVTDLRIVINVCDAAHPAAAATCTHGDEASESKHEAEGLADPHFVMTPNLRLRFPSVANSPRKKRSSPRKMSKCKQDKLYCFNFWNKHTLKQIVKQEKTLEFVNDAKLKENVTPPCQIHDIQRVVNKTQSEAMDESEYKSWFVSMFKFHGMKI